MSWIHVTVEITFLQTLKLTKSLLIGTILAYFWRFHVGITLIYKPHRIYSLIRSEFCNDSQLTKTVSGSTLAWMGPVVNSVL